MPTHKFSVGDRVRYSASSAERNATGVYQVTALMPESNGEWQYRVQNAESAQQRVVWESQLAGIALR